MVESPTIQGSFRGFHSSLTDDAGVWRLPSSGIEKELHPDEGFWRTHVGITVKDVSVKSVPQCTVLYMKTGFQGFRIQGM